jgi:hypothetical protein
VSWNEIKIGWGLQEVDRTFSLACVECATRGREDDRRCKLYTDQRPPTTEREANAIRSRVWCKTHAIWFFKEPESGPDCRW